MMTKLSVLLFGLLSAVLVVLPASARAQSGTTDRSAFGVTCASDDGRRHYCPLDTRGGVLLQKQRSDAACIQGRTWGFDRRGVWVDRGCRAEFVMAGAVRPPVGPGPGPRPPMPGPRIVQCSSDNGGRVNCPADTRAGVRLIKQRSDARCIAGRTWGFTRNSIWVDRGCRADFALGR